MPFLELTNLTYQVGSKKIIDNLCLSIGDSEIHALLGTNGTGKSTLAYLIVGCEGYRPATGSIVFAGQDITDRRIHERAQLGITMAWQEPVRFEGISVAQYLTLRNKELNPAHYLDMVGLQPAHYLTRMVDSSLSGGERKRIELASILALHPKIAILDEPDSGIDMLSTLDIINVINTFKKIGSSVLLITHREEIALSADRASQICNGRIACSGSPQEVVAYYKSKNCLVCGGGECVDERP
ncbi:MAG: ABC transporter ATP-binding protein [Proteobacteria bacterium]|nr:ABC transporter ATP-binding protein [Pseudomonadota bacterium]MBU4296506.1 ABC transporter ATP-binding protein [Pseudomonadota bacterium]MCG2745983.1 ABC transporter ATP-binding protein [Desulfobulbaceae bacterium]